MKHVVMVSADFAPSSLPPALRMRLFARHLPEFGWRPTVITTDPRYYTWPVDPRNDRLLPPSLEVIRTRALAAGPMRKIGIGDIGMRSLWYHWRALIRLCQEQPIDLVFISLPPYATAVLGRLVSRRFGVPYIIDYQDPWITDYYWRLPREMRPGGAKWALSYALARVLEPFALKRVNHVVGVSEGTTRAVIARYDHLTESDTSAIPFGGEASDFDFLRANPERNKVLNPHDGHLHVSYVGACIPAMHGALRTLFEALQLGLLESPELFERVRLHFVGTSYAPDATGLYQVLPLAREMGIEEYVDERPQRIAYLDSLQVLVDSHALVLLGSEEAHYTASKVFPYILARRPLLGIFHEASSAVRIIADAHAGDLVTFSSQRPLDGRAREVTASLSRMLMQPDACLQEIDWTVVERYSARSMTSHLAHVFDTVASNHFVAASPAKSHFSKLMAGSSRMLVRTIARGAAKVPSPIKYRLHRAKGLYGQLLRLGGSVIQIETRVGTLNWRVDRLTSQTLILGTDEPYMQEAFLEFVHAGSIVLDVGAHAGFHSLFCATLVQPGGRVIAFEPNPVNRHSAQSQVLANPGMPVLVLPYALSDRVGDGMLNTSKGTSEGYITPDGDLPVELRTVDALVSERQIPPPDLIKIAVEGHEGEVLKGALETVREHRPVILCDYNNDATLRTVADLLEPLDYSVVPGPPITAIYRRT